MSTEPFLGEVKVLGFNFAPKGYMLCQGQLLSIAQYQALFALLGTMYGGNGTVTFALPDLRGRVPLSQGQGPGLYDYFIGEVLGTENSTLITSNMPSHNHAGAGLQVSIPVSAAPGEEGSPNGTYLTAQSTDFYATAPAAGQHLGGAAVGGMTSLTGGNQPFNNMQPSLTMNYSIAVQGIFPSRN